MLNRSGVSFLTCEVKEKIILLNAKPFFSFDFTATLTEDFCGVEPVTHPPIEIETRPPPEIDEDKLRRAYSRVDTVVLAGK